MRNIGIVSVSFDILAEAMQLPLGHKIVAVEWGDRQGQLNVYVEGSMMPEVEGDDVKKVLVTMHNPGPPKWVKVEVFE